MRAGIGGGFGRRRDDLVVDDETRLSLATLAKGKPGLPTLERYQPADDLREFLAFVGSELNGTFDWNYLDEIRAEWEGPIVLKGVLDPREASEAVAHGVDGILVSTHGGRQMDGAPASITALPAIREAVGDDTRVLLDSGVRTGLDVARRSRLARGLCAAWASVHVRGGGIG